MQIIKSMKNIPRIKVVEKPTLKFQVKWINMAIKSPKIVEMVYLLLFEYFAKLINPPTVAVEMVCITAENRVLTIIIGTRVVSVSPKAMK